MSPLDTISLVPLEPSPIPPTSHRRPKRKDPIGRSVFYPTSLRPPPRSSPKYALPPTPVSPTAYLPSCAKYRRRSKRDPEPIHPQFEEREEEEEVEDVVRPTHGGQLSSSLGLVFSSFPSPSSLSNRVTTCRLAPPADSRTPPSLLVDTVLATGTYTFPPVDSRSTFPPPRPSSHNDQPAFHSPASTTLSLDSSVNGGDHCMARKDSSQSLTGMMQGWNAFSPSTPAQRHDQLEPESATSVQIVSPPEEMRIESLIEEAYLLDDSPTGQPHSPTESKQRRPSRSPMLDRRAHLFESPGHVSPPAALIPMPAAAFARRASAPGGFFPTMPSSPLATHGALKATTPQSALLPPSFSGYAFPAVPVNRFAPGYSLQESNFIAPQQQDYFGPLGEIASPVAKQSLPDPALPPPEVSPTPPPIVASSHMSAEQWLNGRHLHPEFVDRYTLGDVLGQGGFGFVCVAKQTGLENEAGVEVAVKFIIKSRMSESEHDTPDDTPNEAFVLQLCDHPGIIKILDLFEDDDLFYLVMELHGDPWAKGHTLEPVKTSTAHSDNSYPLPAPLLAGANLPASLDSQLPSSNTFGTSAFAPVPAPPTAVRPPMGRRASHDLFEAVEHNRFSEDQARYIFKQIVDAVFYLHSQQIYHRDLKDENIVIDSQLNIKIIDFGSAIVENSDYALTHDVFRGTSNYAAPEILHGHVYHAGPTDIWCLGIILSILLTGESCFPSPQWAARGQIRMKKQVSRLAFDLMMQCLTIDPQLRPSIDVIIEHPWFFGPLGSTGSLP